MVQNRICWTTWKIQSHKAKTPPLKLHASKLTAYRLQPSTKQKAVHDFVLIQLTLEHLKSTEMPLKNK